MPSVGKKIRKANEKCRRTVETMVCYLLKFIVIFVMALPFYLIIRRPWKQFEKREIALAVFWLFMTGLLLLAFEGNHGTPMEMLQSAVMRISTRENINLIPFRTIRSFFLTFTLDAFLINIVGNIVMFLPWGFGVVLLWKKNQSLGRVIALSFLLTAFIETSQLFIGRSVDVDDLILNFIGGCAGAVLYFVIRKKFPQIGELAR